MHTVVGPGLNVSVAIQKLGFGGQEAGKLEVGRGIL